MSHIYNAAHSTRAAQIAADARTVGAAGGVALLDDGKLLVVQLGSTGAMRIDLSGSSLDIENGALLSSDELDALIASGTVTYANGQHFEGDGLVMLAKEIGAEHATALARIYPDAVLATLAIVLEAIADDRVHTDLTVGDYCVKAVLKPSQRRSYSIH